jgi:hypothetical protein
MTVAGGWIQQLSSKLHAENETFVAHSPAFLELWA